MARATVVLDPIFKRVGLSGKSVIPMIIGTGCGIPAIMACRTIRNERERRSTAMLATFMPCGAKLPVIALFAGAFFPESTWVSFVCYMLGIVLGFLALLGLGGSQALYYVISKLLLNTEVQYIKYALDICINATLAYLYTLIIATLYCNIRAGNHIPSFDKDFIIIMGSKIRDDGSLTPLLKGRVDRAIEFGKMQYENTKKKIVYIPSGGRGSDESIEEAKAIKNYLLKKGVSEKQIIIEDKSTSTIENLAFSKKKIDKINKDARISFSTTNFHVFRSGVLANNQGIECEGIGSKTKWYFYTNALIREFVANIVQERKSHIILIVMINLSLLILIAIGYHYNFLYIV